MNTKTGWGYDSVFILVFLWVSAQQFLTPESLIGRTINGITLTVLLGAGMALIGGGVVWLLEKAGFPTTRTVEIESEEGEQV